jgi:4-hydroxy-3-polyprenylbenzoate decarboxylase
LEKLPDSFPLPAAFTNPKLVTKGILAVEAIDDSVIKQINGQWTMDSGLPLIVICDDADFLAADFNNFLWVTFTRSNPSHDIYGINERFENKHWSCDTLIIDARIKPHHAPVLEINPEVQKRVDELLKKYL